MVPAQHIPNAHILWKRRHSRGEILAFCNHPIDPNTPVCLFKYGVNIKSRSSSKCNHLTRKSAALRLTRANTALTTVRTEPLHAVAHRMVSRLRALEMDRFGRPPALVHSSQQRGVFAPNVMRHCARGFGPSNLRARRIMRRAEE
jgi:hypothetical protein